MNIKAVVTGGAGFIGSHLVDSLVADGVEVVVIDRLHRTDAANLAHPRDSDGLQYIRSDLSRDLPVDVFEGSDIVFHLASNSDIRLGTTDTSADLDNTFMTTKNVLDAVRTQGIPRFFFASSSAVYGYRSEPLREDDVGVRPISLYGAMKLASESIVSAYSSLYGFDALVFRFPNVVGPRMTHGVIPDFIEKLKTDSRRLEVLGDGKQCKQYLHVSDLVRGIRRFSDMDLKGTNTFNISADSSTDVDTIAAIVCEEMELSDVEITHTGGNAGWAGDIPRFALDVSKARSAGWTFRYDSTTAVRMAVRESLF